MGPLRNNLIQQNTLLALAHHCTLDAELQELIARFWTQEDFQQLKLPN